MIFITADGKYQWNVVPFGLAATVFEKFQKTGLKIKLSKCQFFKTHII